MKVILTVLTKWDDVFPRFRNSGKGNQLESSLKSLRGVHGSVDFRKTLRRDEHEKMILLGCHEGVG